MSKPEFYKAPPRWHLLVALIGAVAIEVAAVAAANLAKDEQIRADNGVMQDGPFEVVGIEPPPEAPLPPPQDLPPPLPLPPNDSTDFVLSEPTATAHSPRTRPAPRVKTALSHGARAKAGSTSFVSGQSQMIVSPHPGYPFEARRASQTGSGKFLLRFDSNGEVTAVDTVQSTGSAILDQVSIRALRQWRCQPGVYENVYVPITFTLHGAQL